MSDSKTFEAQVIVKVVEKRGGPQEPGAPPPMRALTTAEAIGEGATPQEALIAALESMMAPEVVSGILVRAREITPSPRSRKGN